MSIAPVDTSSFTPAQLAAFNNANSLGSGVQTYSSQPVAQSPLTPTPTIQTPAAPQPVQSGAAGPGTGSIVPQAPQVQPVQPTTQNTTQTTQVNPPQTGVTQPTGTLTMPASGSVVDLLNMAGVDSSPANRSALATQYGVQGYDFSGAKNQELADKFLKAFNDKKGSPVPQNSADATSSIQNYLSDEKSTTDPTKQFMDAFSAMNPIEASLYQQLSGLLSTKTNQQSLTDFYKQESQSLGLPELNLELADMKKIMSGTEDDIRNEINNAGGFATESQVQALTGARNKNLLKQATYLSDVINAKNDYLDHIVSLTEADRTQTSKDLDQKLGITNTLITLSQNMQNAAVDNYNKIVDTAGYSGLAQSLQGNPTQARKVESMLGLAPNSLDVGSKFLSSIPSAKPLQFISGTENQASGVFDPSTGKFTPFVKSGGGGSTTGSSAYDGIIDTILASGKFTQPQAAQVRKAIANGEDPFTVIKNNAKNIMGQTEATKLSSYEAADSAMIDLRNSLNKYYDGGGDTGLLSGSLEQAANKLGQVKDPKKVALATQVAVSLQAYRNAISGTAYSNQEGQQISAIFPGINKSHGLNDAIIDGRLAADQSLIDGIYKTAIGAKAYDQLKLTEAANKPVTLTSLKSQLQPGEVLVARENKDGTRHYVAITPDELWATDIKQ